jgi:type IV pilus assembly protein PilB
MGIDPFLTASSVRIIVAQRLIRVICPNCKVQIDPATQELVQFLNLSSSELSQLKLFKGQGCQSCNNSGYRGRCGLYEILPITQKIQEIIVSKAPAYEIKKQAVADGMMTLRSVALEKLQAGQTTIEEVLGATS